MQEQHIYIVIDLKSFYASVECQERGFDPLTINLVVADSSRTEKIVCLAVSPSLKQVIILVDTTEIPIIDVVEIETYTSAN